MIGLYHYSKSINLQRQKIHHKLPLPPNLYCLNMYLGESASTKKGESMNFKTGQEFVDTAQMASDKILRVC